MDGTFFVQRSVSEGCDRPDLSRPRKTYMSGSVTSDVLSPRPEHLSQIGSSVEGGVVGVKSGCRLNA